MTSKSMFLCLHARAEDYCCRKNVYEIMPTFLLEKYKIVTFGLKIFPKNGFIQTTVYMLLAFCCELEKQHVFQIFKNG